MKKQVKLWIEKAKRDIDNAVFNFKGKRYEEACFFSQQAVEKAFKALDIKISGNFIKSHDLVFLGKKVNAPKDIIDKSRQIKPAYTETRYPDFLPIKTYTKEKAEGIVKYSKEIVKWVKEKLNA